VQYHLIAGYSKGDEDCLFLNVFTHKVPNELTILRDLKSD